MCEYQKLGMYREVNKKNDDCVWKSGNGNEGTVTKRGRELLERNVAQWSEWSGGRMIMKERRNGRIDDNYVRQI